MSERSTFWLSHLSAIEAEGITTKAYAGRAGPWGQAGAAAAPSRAGSSRTRSNLQ